jgi:hypothetical protein
MQFLNLKVIRVVDYGILLLCKVFGPEPGLIRIQSYRYLNHRMRIRFNHFGLITLILKVKLIMEQFLNVRHFFVL